MNAHRDQEGWLVTPHPLQCDDCHAILPRGAQYRRVVSEVRGALVICRECVEAAETCGVAGSWE